MKSTFKILGIIALVALVMFSVGACKKDKAAPPAPAPVSVSGITWDAYIADAEKLVNEMVPLMEKIQAGDSAASVALSELFVKFDALETKYSGLDESTMTPAQTQKIADIMGKINP